MRSLRPALSVLATAVVVVTLAVAPPAQAAPTAPQPPALPSPDTVWTPPEDADDAVIPDANLPDEPWKPQEETRLQSHPEGNQRGLAPLGAPVGTVAGAPGTGEQPWFSFQDFALAPDSTARVNIANGNLLVKANDLAIPVPGYGLRHDRFYNGLSTDPGSQGGGWHSSNGTYDIGLQNMGSYADFYGPNGIKLRFTRVGSTNTFTSPAGSNMTLRQDSPNGTFAFVLTTNKTGEQLKFSGTGYLTASQDRNGVGEYYAYSAGNIATSYHDNGRGLSFAWSMDGFLEKVQDTAGRNVEYTYDTAAPRLKTVKSVDGKITTYNYDSAGRLSSIVLPSAAATTTTVTFTYDSSHRVTKVSQQPGIETTFTYSSGQTVVTDSNGHLATYSIDSSGRVTSTKDGLNRIRSQTWTANSDVATTTDAIGANTTTYTYDGSNNRTGAQLPTGAAASAAYATDANCSAPNTGTTFQPKCSTDDAGNKKQYQYDAAGNPTKQTDTTTSTALTEFERTYGGCGGFAGQVCSAKDGNGNTTTYAYDAEGSLTTVTPPTPLGATTYTYDSLGRVTSVTDGKGDTTGYQYDVRDRIVLTTFEDGQNIISTYYANGLEHTRTDSGGGATTYEYDPQGRLTKQTGPRPGVMQTYTYDEIGNILTYSDAGGATTYTYDAANQLIRLQEPGGSCPASGIPAANSGCVLFEYDQNGLETKRILPAGANTVTTRDASGRPTRITAKTGTGGAAVDIGYTYAAAGSSGDRVNVQTRTAFKEEGITAGAVTSYAYDSRNRLTLAQEKTGATTSASWAYAYDNAGNRTQQARSGSTGAAAGTINYGYNAANQLISATGQTTTWTYDAAGNQTRNGSTGNATSYGDRLEATQIGSTPNTYFGTGNTDRLAAGSTTFDSSALGLAQRTAGTSTQSYTRTPEGDAVGFKVTSRWYYIQDHLGSVVGIFSSSGSYSGGYSYSPYGEARATVTTTTAVTINPLRYIGQHHDGNGIYKLGARYYDTAQGRFTQMDPSGQETHPYAYAQNSPSNLADPTGLISQECFLGGCSVYFSSSETSDIASSGVLALGGLATACAFLGPPAGAACAIASGAVAATAVYARDHGQCAGIYYNPATLVYPGLWWNTFLYPCV